MGQLLTRAFVAVGLALNLVGCGTSQPTGPGPPRPGPDIAELLFPSAKYNAEGRELSRARDELIRRCMAVRGLTYAPMSHEQRGMAYVRAIEGTPAGRASIRVRGITVTYQTNGCLARATTRLRGDLRRYYALIVYQNEARAIVARWLAAGRRDAIRALPRAHRLAMLALARARAQWVRRARAVLATRRR